MENTYQRLYIRGMCTILKKSSVEYVSVICTKKDLCCWFFGFFKSGNAHKLATTHTQTQHI